MSASVNNIVELSRQVFTPNGTYEARDTIDAESSYAHMSEERLPLATFPVEVYPPPIQKYIEEGATAINVPPDMIAVPLLGFAAGVIGNTRSVRVKSGWVERANLWLSVIGDPGSGKSPANDYARAPLDQLQSEAWTTYQDQLSRWEQAVANARASKEPDSESKERPTLAHYFTTDATTEAIAGILKTSPGVAMVRDELVGWVKSHDAYKKGGDRQSYLSLWAGAPLKVDRAGSETKHIPYPCVPIVGGIQPDMLSDLADEAQRRDGFVERMLMSWPDPLPITWNDAPLDSIAASSTTFIFRQLRVAGEITSKPSEFTPEARKVFGAWYVDNGRIIKDSLGIASGFYSKYPGQLARIALVLHALHYPDIPDRPIGVETVSDAIQVIEYFRSHLVRVLPRFSATGSSRSAGLATRIFRVLQKTEGGWVSRRELSRGLGNSVEAADIDDVLEALESEGRIENRTVHTGARPRQEARILPRTNEHMSNRQGENQ